MRIPWLLHRAVLGDLVRTTLLTATVLVTVIAFGAAVRPLSQNLLGPADLPRFLLLACVPMLQYALPFAAAFATVTVYHRMSVDREVQAMEASGFPMRRIVFPAVALGMLLFAAMLAVVHLAAPAFWMSMQDLLARDAARLLANAVEQGEGLRVGDLEIYADEALLSPDPPDTGARDRLILAGVAALEFGGRSGVPRTEFTAEHAVIDVHQGEDGAILKLVLVNATVQRDSEQAIAVLPEASPEAIDLGRSLAGDPKGLPLTELLRAREEPEAFRPMREAAGPLEERFDRLEALDCLDSALGSDEGADLESLGSGRTIRVIGAARAGDRLTGTGADGLITLEERRDGRMLRRASVATGTIALESGSTPSFELAVAPGLEAEEFVGSVARRGRWPQRLGGLHQVECAVSIRPGTTAELIATGRAAGAAADNEADPLRRTLLVEAGRNAGALETALDRFQLDILARLNQRGAQALAGLLLPILAALVAVRSRASIALGTFIVVFIPAIAVMLMVSSGEQMTRWNRPEAGISLIWAAMGGLCLAIVVAWWKSTRRVLP